MIKKGNEKILRNNTFEEEVIEEGANQKAIEIAKNMLIKNIDINLISEMTSLNTEIINDIKNET